MKVALVLLFATACWAGTVPTKLGFRNLYVTPIGGVEEKPAPKIIGGQEAAPHSIPHQAFLTVYGGSSGWYCGGSLISNSVVLTAGHCGDGADEAEVVLGAHKPLSNENTQVRVTSSDIVVHERYNADDISNDIALIRLKKPVDTNSNIATVPLPSSDGDKYEGDTARISGWGLTNGHGDSISDVLNYVDVKVIANKECSRIFNIIRDSNICTSGEDNTGSCSGDSGGPLTVDGVQVGIVSFGVQYCPAGYPSAFTRVTSYLDWIKNNS